MHTGVVCAAHIHPIQRIRSLDIIGASRPPGYVAPTNRSRHHHHHLYHGSCLLGGIWICRWAVARDWLRRDSYPIPSSHPHIRERREKREERVGTLAHTQTLGIWARAGQLCNGPALMAIGESYTVATIWLPAGSFNHEPIGSWSRDIHLTSHSHKQHPDTTVF